MTDEVSGRMADAEAGNMTVLFTSCVLRLLFTFTLREKENNISKVALVGIRCGLQLPSDGFRSEPRDQSWVRKP